MEDFPGNSQRARRPVREEPEKSAVAPKLEKVVEGEVIRRRKPLGKRVRETFLGGDGPTMWEYVVADILVPGIRDIFADAATGGIERILYGESRSSYRRPGARFGGPPGRVDYRGFASPPVGSRVTREEPRQTLSRRARASHDFEEIIIPSRTEAEAVLEGLFAFLDQYGEVNVSTLYELVGISSNFTEDRWGWTDLRGSRVEHTRHGYLLNLPRPELLER